MSNTSDKLREIAEKCFPMDKRLSEDWLYNSIQQKDVDTFVSDLTVLISEHYTEKAKYDEAVRQRDELLAAMIKISMAFQEEGEPYFKLAGVSEMAEAAIRLTEI